MKDSYLVCLLLINLLVSIKSYALDVQPISVREKVSSLNNSSLLISNNTTQDQYIELTVKKVINPGTPEEHLIDADSREFDVYPRVFINRPNNKRKVFMLYNGEPIESEVAYRIYVEDKVSRKRVESEEVYEDVSLNITTNIRYGVLVLLYPDVIKYDYQVESKADSWTVVNNGNVRFHLAYSKCSEEGVAVDFSQRLYPGSSTVIGKCGPSRLQILNESKNTLYENSKPK